MRRVRVAVEAMEAITKAGLVAYFQSRVVSVVADEQRADANVVVVATNRLDAKATTALQTIARTVGAPVVLLINEIDETDLSTAVECDVVAILPRSAVADERLVQEVEKVAVDGGVVERDLYGHLAAHVRRVQREVLATSTTSASNLTNREAEVLLLVADGLGTGEIARMLCYSERTVKNVIYSITSRLQLRNRPHAVAYALRTGMLDASRVRLARMHTARC